MLNNFYNNLIHKNILIISNIYFNYQKKFSNFCFVKKNIKINLIINNKKQKKFNY